MLSFSESASNVGLSHPGGKHTWTNSTLTPRGKHTKAKNIMPGIYISADTLISAPSSVPWLNQDFTPIRSCSSVSVSRRWLIGIHQVFRTQTDTNEWSSLRNPLCVSQAALSVRKVAPVCALLRLAACSSAVMKLISEFHLFAFCYFLGHQLIFMCCNLILMKTKENFYLILHLPLSVNGFC